MTSKGNTYQNPRKNALYVNQVIIIYVNLKLSTIEKFLHLSKNNIDFMLAKSRRQWANIESTLVKCLVFAGEAILQKMTSAYGSRDLANIACWLSGADAG